MRWNDYSPSERTGGQQYLEPEIAMDVLTLLIVGLIAGLVITLVLGGVGHEILGGTVKGVAGALLGGWLFTVLDIRAPFIGIVGSMFVALIGAVALLLVPGAISTRRRA